MGELFIGAFLIGMLFVILPFIYIIFKGAFEVWTEIIDNIFNR